MNDDDVTSLIFDPESLNMEWFYVVRYFDEADDAAAAFKKMNEHAARLKGKAEIAGYRLMDAEPASGGEPRIVVVLGQKEERVGEAAEMLGGLAYYMPPGMIVTLVARRLRFLLAGDALGVGPGHFTFQHGKGMRLNPAGEVVPLEVDDV